MSDRIRLRYRRVPGGEFFEGYQVGCKGTLLEFDPASPDAGLIAGDLLEIECGCVVYLGQLEEFRETTGVVFIEHMIDLAKLTAIDEAWR